ncbi:TetR/AcrR family transcriptional regulator C-terminal domain-containing protein [Paenirhodobacter populi]
MFSIPSPRMAAEQFLAMVRGNEHMRALLDLQSGRDAQAQDIYLASCADLFIRAFRVG